MTSDGERDRPVGEDTRKCFDAGAEVGDNEGLSLRFMGGLDIRARGVERW